MNIAYFLIPKASIAYLYDDCTFRQGLEKMRRHGYAAIPVISRSGQYVGTVSEGDFLWRLVQTQDQGLRAYSKRELESIPIREILDRTRYPAAGITLPLTELVQQILQQNFVPVVDDAGSFVGIVTRRAIMQQLLKEEERAESVS